MKILLIELKKERILININSLIEKKIRKWENND